MNKTVISIINMCLTNLIEVQPLIIKKLMFFLISKLINHFRTVIIKIE